MTEQRAGVKKGERGHGASLGGTLFLIALMAIGGWCSWDGLEHGIQRIACERAVCEADTCEPGAWCISDGGTIGQRGLTEPQR